MIPAAAPTAVGPKKYGKLAPRHDPRRLAIADYLPAPLPDAPASCDNTGGIPVGGWGTMLNTRIGNCTIASYGHGFMSMSTTAGKGAPPAIVPDSAILEAYEAVSGYDPATGANDDGALITDVNEYVRTIGIGGHKSRAWASIPTGDAGRFRKASYYFGGVNVGFQLPQSAEQQFDAGQPWTVPWFSPIAGGHCIWLVGYDPDWIYGVTWGRCILIAYDFYFRYCDEAYTVIDDLWFASGDGLDRTGLRIDQLAADQASLATAA